MMKKISLIVLAMILIFSFVVTGCSISKPQSITQDQMVVAQMNYSQNVYPIVSEMADSYSQYIAFNISEDKFKESVKGLLARYNDVEKNYAEFNKKYVLENPSTDMKTAITSIENARKSIGSILQGTIKDNKVIPRDDILVLYMKESASMQTNLETFKKIVANLYAATK